MIKRIDLSGWELKFVLRHRWENQNSIIGKFEWNTLSLGVWYKKYKVIKKPKHTAAIIGKSATLTNQHMLGINLLVCKLWFTICHRPFNIEFE